MLSLSQRDSVPLGDDDKQVNATQYDHERTKENMGFVWSNEDHTTPIENINNDHVDVNVVVCVEVARRTNE